VDLALELPCEPYEGVCFAGEFFAAQHPYMHRDPACTSGDVAYLPLDFGCSPPRFARVVGGGFGTLKEEFDPDALYYRFADSCEPRVPGEFSGTVHRFAAPEPEDAAPLQLANSGEGRLQLRTPFALEGDRLGPPTPSWFDTELGMDCVFFRGPELCMPMTEFTTRYYQDEVCATPLVSNPAGFVAGWFTVERVVGGELEYLGAARVQGDYAGPVFVLSDEGCAPAEDPENFGPYVELEIYQPEELGVLEEARP